MRLKYYLRGVGLGIIFTVIIMTIGSHTSKAKSDQTATESISKTNTEFSTEIHKSTEQNKINQTDTSKDDSSQTGDISTNEITDDITTDEITGSTAGDVAGDTASNASSDTPDVSAQSDKQTTFTINVSGSDTCRTISERLQAAGLVDDSEKFRIYMGQKGVDHLISDGDHEIPYGASYDDIINILTQK